MKSINELPENIKLEIDHNEQVSNGKIYFKEIKQSYSDELQVYIYYDHDTPLSKVLNNMEGEIEINLVQKELNTVYNKKYEIIPVGANWTENRHILGFYNVITGEYEKTCSLDLILKAERDLAVPYFFNFR